MDKTGTVAVTGAGGHVGSRLAAVLGERGYRVRALTRADGDVGDRDAMLAALDGVQAAFYLVHALAGADELEQEERRVAREFAFAARARGVQRLVYLGGIVHDDDLSPHLNSRREVGEILRSSGIDTVELRASIVIGEGSASFELVRGLVEQLPVLLSPDWLDNAAQPIAVDDVVEYLVAALDVRVAGEAVYEIGGADRVTYRALVDEVARQLGREPTVVTVPVPAPPLPKRLVPLLPDRARLVANLLESLRFESDVRSDAALRDFDVRPRGIADAVAAALAAS